MRAVLCTRYGPPDVLRLADVDKPTPGDDEVLIRVRAASVAPGDCEVRRFDLPTWIWLPLRLYLGLRRPRQPILGMELAGEIESVGTNVTRFKPGDQVFGSTGLRFGAYAEYACLPADGPIAIKPATITFEDATPVPVGGMNALHFLSKASIRRGESVLINGACGNIGTFAVQLAKHLGAEITAVDSADKLETLRSLGADHVIDYTCEEFTASGTTYDVIFDVVGKAPFAACLRCLKPNGRLLIANPRLSHMIRGRWVSSRSDKTVITEPAGETPEQIATLVELIESGTLRSVIDRRFPLEQIVDAHAYVESGVKQGQVVVTMERAG